jgi:hypothetical protein
MDGSCSKQNLEFLNEENMNLRYILPTLFMIVALCFATFAQGNGNGNGKPPKPSPTPTPTPTPSPTPTPAPGSVISARFIYCASGDTACEASNRVRQDQNSPWVNGSQGVTISFNVGVSGDLTINLMNSTRSVVYDLRDRVNDGNPTPSWVGTPQNLKLNFNSHEAYNAKLIASCSNGICESNYQTTLNGGGYKIGQYTYRTQWNPLSMFSLINQPDITSFVNVHYYQDATGETWTITPLPNTHGHFLAGLMGEKGNTQQRNGQYNMPFRLVVTVR